MKKKLIGFILCGLILATAAGCSDTPTQVGQINNSSMESADVTSDREDKDNSDDFTAEKDQLSQTADSASSESQSEIPAEKKEESAVPPVTNTDKTEKNDSEVSSASESNQSESGNSESATSEPSQSQANEQPSEVSKPTGSITASVPNSMEVQQKVAQYINKYRNKPMTILSGLTCVAEYRSRQLITNFSHDEDMNVCDLLKYGEYVDMGKYGYPEDSYYRGFSREAIAKGNWTGTADEIAQKIAEGFRNSSNHWNYLSSNEYKYMAVGCTYDKATQRWYCCVCISDENYGG